MSSSFKQIEKNVVQLEVEVSIEVMEQASVKVAKKMAAKVNIPGFRKGKAPKKLVESYYGPAAVLEETADAVLSEAYASAVLEHNIFPVDKPEIDVVTLENGKPFVFTAKITVKPEVELGTYKGLEVEKEVKTVSEEDVNKQLDALQKRYAKLVNIEKESVITGDIVLIDYDGYTEGEQFEGGKGENYSLEIGSNSFIPGFEEQIIGMVLNEEKEINVTFPEEYHEVSLASKPAVFKVVVKGIKRKELSELNDEFAKDVSDFDTLVELKANLKSKLVEGTLKKAEDDIKEKLIIAATANAKVEIPDIMVQHKVDDYVKDLEMRLSQQGLTLEQYIGFAKISLDEIKADYKNRAEERVNQDLVLSAIAKAENIVATDLDVEIQINEMATMYKQDPATMRAYLEEQGSLFMIKENLIADKVIKFIFDNAIVTEK
ncbi:MAG: trigger factor [Clostridia bacterium]